MAADETIPLRNLANAKQHEFTNLANVIGKRLIRRGYCEQESDFMWHFFRISAQTLPSLHFYRTAKYRAAPPVQKFCRSIL